MRSALPTINALLLVATLAGLIARGRLSQLRTLPLYLALCILERVPIMMGEPWTRTWAYWLATDLAEAALRLALGAELLARVFGRLPVGWRTAQRLAAIVLGATWLAIALAPAPAAYATADQVFYAGALRAAQATLAAGILFAAVLVLAARYAIPLEPLHRDVAAGLVLWSALQAFPSELAILDPWLGIGREGLQRLAFTGVLVAWSVAAWRGARETGLSPAALRLLQPWRVPG